MEQITELLKQLADKLGTTSEYLWSVLIAQAKIEAMISLVLIVVGIVIFIIGIYSVYLMRKPYKEYTSYYAFCHEEDFAPMPYAFTGIIWFISIVILVSNVKDFLTANYNPAYYALKEILSNL